MGFYSSLKSPDFRYVQNRNPHFSSGSREAGKETYSSGKLNFLEGQQNEVKMVQCCYFFPLFLGRRGDNAEAEVVYLKNEEKRSLASYSNKSQYKRQGHLNPLILLLIKSFEATLQQPTIIDYSKRIRPPNSKDKTKVGGLSSSSSGASRWACLIRSLNILRFILKS